MACAFWDSPYRACRARETRIRRMSASPNSPSSDHHSSEGGSPSRISMTLRREASVRASGSASSGKNRASSNSPASGIGGRVVAGFADNDGDMIGEAFAVRDEIAVHIHVVETASGLLKRLADPRCQNRLLPPDAAAWQHEPVGGEIAVPDQQNLAAPQHHRLDAARLDLEHTPQEQPHPVRDDIGDTERGHAAAPNLKRPD